MAHETKHNGPQKGSVVMPKGRCIPFISCPYNVWPLHPCHEKRREQEKSFKSRRGPLFRSARHDGHAVQKLHHDLVFELSPLFPWEYIVVVYTSYASPHLYSFSKRYTVRINLRRRFSAGFLGQTSVTTATPCNNPGMEMLTSLLTYI